MTPRIKNLLDDPTTPFWAKKLIRESLDRDPVDVANVLEVLSKAFSQRVQLLQRSELKKNAER